MQTPLQGYSFWDFETTGLHPAFDHPLQYAAILTDFNLSQTSELHIRCRPRKSVLPHPQALIITGTDIEEAQSRMTSHHTMMRMLAAHYSKLKPTLHIGFNSLDFDEKVQCHSLWQNLLPAYATRLNGHSRADVLKIAHVVHKLQPGCFETKTNMRGKPSFKLQDLATANGIITHDAHDALGDSRATMAVFKLLKDVAAPVVEACLSLAHKVAAQQTVQTAEVFVEFRTFYGRTDIVPLVQICETDSSSEHTAFNLKYEPAEYVNRDPASLLDVMLGNSGPRAVTFVKANRSAFILPIGHELLAGVFPKSQIELFKERAYIIRESLAFRRSVSQAAIERTRSYSRSEFLEERIYEGFTTAEDSEILDEFQMAPPTSKWTHIARLSDERLRELALRVLWEEWPEAMPRRDFHRMESEMLYRMTTTRPVPWTTTHSGRYEAQKLMLTATDAELKLLKKYLRYLDRVEACCLPDAAD